MQSIFELLNKGIFIIAEIGCNHNGDMAIARDLVRRISEAGADAAKFQSFNPEDMITENSPKATYQIKATGMKESQYQRLSKLKLNRKEHEELKCLCEDYNISFCSSAFDHRSAVLLNELDVPFFKLGSGEITNLPLIEHIGLYGKPVILSTGMSNLGEIENAINTIGKNRGNVILMHCVSDYPTQWEEANLRAIKTLREAFHLPVGFSDHTEGIELPLVAIGLGAVVIEKHITLSRDMEGGDHKASLEPHEFKEMVSKIRRLEKALGDGVKRCMPSEENVREVARKSIVANRTIKKGETIGRENIAIKRPGTGIPPSFIDKIIGSRTRENISADEQIRWSQLDYNDSKNNYKPSKNASDDQ